MSFNKKIFFNEVRKSLFNGKLSQSQVDNMTTLLNIWNDDYSENPLEYLAYCLGTAFHEVGSKMEPVREGFKDTDQAAIQHVVRMYRRGRIKKNYARKNPKTGHSYFGRGIVQLTHAFNYRKATKKLGIDFYNHPEKALEVGNSAHILFRGCIEGWFTGKKLGDYIKGKKKNYRQARRIVNGMDKASLISGYAQDFERALKKSQGVREEEPKKKEFDKKEVIKSSRRLTFIQRAIRFIEWAGLGATTWTFSTLEKVSDFATDPRTIGLLIAGVAVYMVFHYIKYMSIREYKEGRYKPSKDNE
jgi:predicted chitinase